MERRQVAADETRSRIMQAARKLLFAEDFREFTIDAVAKAADVSRLTVYYQFDSKAGLLEALYDSIARSGHLQRIADVFRYGNVALQKIHQFMEIFVEFWASERDVIRRLHALGVIDPEVGKGLRARNERRRKALSVLVDQYSVSALFIKIREQIVIDKLHMLTSFETFDALAINGRSADEVYQILKKMADQTLGLWPPRVFKADPVKIEPRRRRSRSSRRRSQS
jgi:AcrR family transcriptional regulator